MLSRDFLPKCLDVVEGFGDFLPAPICFGHELGDAAAMPGDHNCLATLDRVEQFGQMGLCLGSRDFPQRRAVSPESGCIFGKLTATARFHGGETLTNLIGQFR